MFQKCRTCVHRTTNIDHDPCRSCRVNVINGWESDELAWSQLEQNLLNAAAELINYTGAAEITVQGKRNSKANRLIIEITATRERSISIWSTRG